MSFLTILKGMSSSSRNNYTTKQNGPEKLPVRISLFYNGKCLILCFFFYDLSIRCVLDDGLHTILKS